MSNRENEALASKRIAILACISAFLGAAWYFHAAQRAESARISMTGSLMQGKSIADSMLITGKAVGYTYNSSILERACELVRAHQKDAMSAIFGMDTSLFLGQFAPAPFMALPIGALLGYFCFVGARLLSETLHNIAHPGSAPRPRDEYERRIAIYKQYSKMLGTALGVGAYGLLKINQRDLPVLFICLLCGNGATDSAVELFVYSLLCSNPRLSASRERTETLHQRNREIFDKIRRMVTTRLTGDAESGEASFTTDELEPIGSPAEENFICPITQCIMLDPVTAPDGKNYEREALREWYFRGKTTCPLDPSKALGAPTDWTENVALKTSIHAYLLSRRARAHSMSGPPS